MSQQLGEVWSVKNTDFPFKGSQEEKLLFLLRFAILAPSAHNTQPWKCRIRGGALTVYLDPVHALGVSDPTHREAYFSLGAFGANFAAALQAYSLDYSLRWLPEGRDLNGPAVIIKVRNLRSARLKDAGGTILQSIVNRRVDRSIYSRKKVPGEILKEIKSLNKEAEFRVDAVVNRNMQEKIAAMIRLGTVFAFKNEKFRGELSHYITPNISLRRDGIPGYTAGLGLLSSFLLPKIMKRFDIGSSQARLDEERFLSAQAILVISSATDESLAWLKSGFLFEKIALHLTEKNLAHSIAAAPIEAPTLPAKLQAIIGTDYRPQMLFRIGYSRRLAGHSPRREVSDILIN